MKNIVWRGATRKTVLWRNHKSCNPGEDQNGAKNSQYDSVELVGVDIVSPCRESLNSDE